MDTTLDALAHALGVLICGILGLWLLDLLTARTWFLIAAALFAAVFALDNLHWRRVAAFETMGLDRGPVRE